MCHCGCADEVENSFRKLGDKIIVIENTPSCKFCGSEASIMISVLKENHYDIFKQLERESFHNIKELGYWIEYEDSILIKKSDFRKL